MKRSLFLFLSILLFWACQSEVPAEDEVKIKEIATAIPEGGEPNLFVSEAGNIYLSWVAYLNDTTNILQYARLEDGVWNSPTEIARGTDWFVNWADFPSLAVFREKEETLAAHWLQKSANGTYDYDVRVSISKDAGENWSPSFVPHTDGISAEHGFVTLLPMQNDRLLATWLDGRNTKSPAGEGHDDHKQEHNGAMTLRTAEFDVNGLLFEEAELDDRICDCCQTDAALTSLGPVVVYRDRSEREIRDIFIVRKLDGEWTSPKPVSSDNWRIAGCPVNGPAVAARNQQLAVAWFTGAKEENRVKVALSEDAGASFTPAFTIDDGNPIGRVDIVFTAKGEALISWIEQVAGGGEIRVAKVDQTGKQGKSITLMSTGISRQSGFPILETHEGSYILAWTSGEEKTTVRTIQFEL